MKAAIDPISFFGGWAISANQVRGRHDLSYLKGKDEHAVIVPGIRRSRQPNRSSLSFRPRLDRARALARDLLSSASRESLSSIFEPYRNYLLQISINYLETLHHIRYAQALDALHFIEAYCSVSGPRYRRSWRWSTSQAGEARIPGGH